MVEYGIWTAGRAGWEVALNSKICIAIYVTFVHKTCYIYIFKKLLLQHSYFSAPLNIFVLCSYIL